MFLSDLTNDCNSKYLFIFNFVDFETCVLILFLVKLKLHLLK